MKIDIYIKNKLNIIIFCLLFIFINLFFFSPASFAADISFTAIVDKNKVSVGDEIALSLTAKGGKPSEPDIPYSGELDISFQGNSSQMQIINGDITSAESFNYIIIPQKAGKYKIGPFSTEIDGKKYFSEAINIEVMEVKEKNSIDNKDIVFVTAEVDNKNPYLNEEIIYTFKFYRRVSTGNNNLNYPDFKDFWVEDINNGIEYEKIINGQRYIITEVKKALFPSKTGMIEIPPTYLQIEIIYQEENTGFGIFSQTKTALKNFGTESIRLNVKPLPGNKPYDFSGIVGSGISVSEKINSLTVNTGDSLVFNLSVRGKGNITDLKHPGLKLKNVKIYRDKPVEKKVNISNELITEKTFNYAIVPLKGGDINIPPIKVSYFNTKNNMYETISSKSYTVKVVGSSENTSQINTNFPEQNESGVKIMGQDIFGVHNDLDGIKNRKLSGLKLLFYFAWFLCLPLIYILSSFKIRTKNELKKSKVNLKKNFKKAISEINLLEVNENSDNYFIGKISLIFSNYIKNKISFSEQNFVSEIEKLNTSEDLKVSVRQLIEKLEYIKFSGKKVGTDEKKEIAVNVKSILERLESEIK